MLLQKSYITPIVHETILHVEQGFGASLEIPIVDPEQGWTKQSNEDIIEE